MDPAGIREIDSGVSEVSMSLQEAGADDRVRRGKRRAKLRRRSRKARQAGLPNEARRGLRINTFCEVYDLSHEWAYELMRRGVLEYVYVRGRRLISVASAEALLREGDGDGPSRRGRSMNARHEVSA